MLAIQDCAPAWVSTDVMSTDTGTDWPEASRLFVVNVILCSSEEARVHPSAEPPVTLKFEEGLSILTQLAAPSPPFVTVKTSVAALPLGADGEETEAVQDVIVALTLRGKRITKRITIKPMNRAERDIIFIITTPPPRHNLQRMLITPAF